MRTSRRVVRVVNLADAAVHETIAKVCFGSALAVAIFASFFVEDVQFNEPGYCDRLPMNVRLSHCAQSKQPWPQTFYANGTAPRAAGI